MIHLTLNSFSSEKIRQRKERKKEVSFNSILISRRWKKDISLEFSFVLRRNFWLDLKLPPRKFRNKRMERTLRFCQLYLSVAILHLPQAMEFNLHRDWNKVQNIFSIPILTLHAYRKIWDYSPFKNFIKTSSEIRLSYLSIISILLQYMYERKCARLILKRRIFPGERFQKESYL